MQFLHLKIWSTTLDLGSWNHYLHNWDRSLYWLPSTQERQSRQLIRRITRSTSAYQMFLKHRNLYIWMVHRDLWGHLSSVIWHILLPIWLGEEGSLPLVNRAAICIWQSALQCVCLRHFMVWYLPNLRIVLKAKEPSIQTTDHLCPHYALSVIGLMMRIVIISSLFRS